MTSPDTTSQSRDALLAGLLRLRLPRIAADLDDIVARATKNRLAPLPLLEELVRVELGERERRSLETRLRAAGIGKTTPIVDFDWNWPKKIDRAAIERALRGDLVREKENLLLVAANGLGKTTIAKNIAHQTVLGGRSALFITAAKMILDLSACDSARALERRLRHYARPDLLVIDEVGYLTFEARAADLLYEVINRRYQHRSVVITTNLAFSDWPTVFPNATTVAALVDRLIEHGEIVKIEGDSYRVRQADERKRKRAKSSPAA